MKDTFYEGQKVWILPFDEVAYKGEHSYHGISKDIWESDRKKNPVTILKLFDLYTDYKPTAKMAETGFYWPLNALSTFDPEEARGISSVSVGDLL